MGMKAKISGFTFLLICIVAMIVINYYPVGDWVSAPLITWFIMLPTIIIEIILLFILFNTKRTKLTLSIQGFLAAICLFVMAYYVAVH